MKTTKSNKKIRTHVRAGKSESEVMNNPLYQGSGTDGSNPLYGG